MISICINGRLGNQMFQLAAAYSLAVKHKTKILPDERSGKYYITDIFENTYIYPWHWIVMHSFCNNLPIRLYRFFVKWIMPVYYSCFKQRIFKPIDYMQIAYEFHDLPDNTAIDGYFQSQYYFQNIQNSIHHIFKIKDQHIENWKKYINRFPPFQKLIAVHIRLNDYKTLGHLQLGGDNLTLPAQYYIDLVNTHNTEDSRIIVMSDEPNTVTEWFKEIPNIIISQESVENDLITITQADICILSHSTFSWWGAWLNKKNNKQVYIPKYFLGFKIHKEVPEYIIPNEWIQVEVSE
jgi:hypothetical protein